MEASLSGVNSVIRNLLFLLGECRGVMSKGRFCRYVVASASAKLWSALSLRNGRVSSPDRELFLRLKHADLWFASALGSGELWSYIEIYSRREYEADVIRFDSKDVILDVGANIGLFAIRYGNEFPKIPVHCFEPNPTVYRRLVRNLKANSIRNAGAVNSAITASDGSVPFYVGSSTVTGSICAREPTMPSFYADTQALDSYCYRHSIESIGLLKVDVEGAEVEVLKGAQSTLKITKLIMIECHSHGLESSVRAMLASHGFEAMVKRDFMYGARVLHFTRPDSNRQCPTAMPS
jgi:FkbM family methyltransferase